MSSIPESGWVPSLQALALQTYIENRLCDGAVRSETEEVQAKFPDFLIGGHLFSQWELLYRNAPPGPLAIRKMMRDTEDALQRTLAPSQAQTPNTGQPSSLLYRLAPGVELPKDYRASLLFRNLNETLRKSIREGEEWRWFNITSKSKTALRKILKPERIYVAPEQMAKLQVILTEGLASAKLESLWKTFRDTEVPRFIRAKAMQKWFRDPAHADQIKSIISIGANRLFPLQVLPPEIGLFSGIRSLFVGPPGSGHSHILAHIPESLGDLRNLTKLQAHDQMLEHIPDAFGKLTNLQDLFLEGNALEQLPESFGNLTNLKVLWLSRNHFEHLPHSIGSLTSLTTLDLSSNKLQSLLPSFAGLIHLNRLNISHNYFEHLPESLFIQLKALKSLDLSYNRLVRLPSSLALLTNLSNLIVEYNPLLLLSTRNQFQMKNYRLACYQEHLLSTHSPQTDASRLFQAIVRGDNPATTALVQALNPLKKDQIFSRYRFLKANFGSPANSSSSFFQATPQNRSPILSQRTLFAKSLLGIAYQTFYCLTEAQKARVVSLVHGLENRPPEGSPYQNMLRFVNALEYDQNMLRFVDALEIVEQETDSLKRKKDDPSNSFPDNEPDLKKPRTSESGSSSSSQS